MKFKMVILLLMVTLTGCAYFEGLRNQKSVVPIPKNESPPATTPSVTQTSGSAAATEQAAKAITPVRF